MDQPEHSGRVNHNTGPLHGLNYRPASPDSNDSGEQNTPDNGHGIHEITQEHPDMDKEGGKRERKGRRKINIEFIDDKSRRHITFSKRKSGIMKKVIPAINTPTSSLFKKEICRFTRAFLINLE